MAHSLQGVYSPLPQSLSDSDSEKEISMEPLCTNYGNNSLKTNKLDNSSCRQNGHMGFNGINDDVLKAKRVNPKMSTLRKTAFMFSILLCFLPIIIFLWVLPCSTSNTCPVRISNWEYERDYIELQGKINLVRGTLQTNLNLMYKGSFNTPKVLKNGIISFKGSNGAVVWDFQQESYPSDMNCSIIDIDGDGFKDCLVVDERGLKAIEAISGEAVWHAHSVEEKAIPELEMPVKLTDFNNDGVSELLSIYKKERFLLISGKNGLALSNIQILPLCIVIANLTTVSHKIIYNCKNMQNLVKTYEIAFTDLNRKFQNSLENIVPTEVITSGKEVFYETGNHKLKVENFDNCPHCRSVVSLYNINGELKSWSYQNAFVMTPVPFSFHSSKDNISLKGHVNGFILKIWEWIDHPKKLSPTIKIYKRSIPISNQTYYLNEISERVVLITFNESDTHFINTSLTNVFQICNGLGYQNSCQPDYKKQQDSLLIVDMDHDDSQELISYSSSYTKKYEDGNDNWHLVSYLRVLRLENELLKSYGSK